VSGSSTVVDDLALRHLDAAYNLGRWLLGNEHDAADAVHDAFVRASRAADTYAGGNARAWWLAIVRNCCLARLAARGRERRNVAIDQVASEHGPEAADALLTAVETTDAGDRIDDAQRRSLVASYLKDLPAEFREVLVLREIEELSYREIADVLQAPIGTVMSRLARGRAMLQKAINPKASNEVKHGL
jgi:RNA polymerase sigma-70 factor (ECF subfamily)